MLITQQGKILRMASKDIRTIGRATQGVRLIDIEGDDRAVSIARLAEKDDEEPAPPASDEPAEPPSDPEPARRTRRLDAPDGAGGRNTSSPVRPYRRMSSGVREKSKKLNHARFWSSSSMRDTTFVRLSRKRI